jgi:hypothetical protein
MVLGALGWMHNADFEKQIVNDNIVLDVFIIFQALRHVQSILKKSTVLVLIDLQSNFPKRP